MATRLYFPSTGAAPITPAASTWTETTGVDHLVAVRARIASSMASKTQAHSATAGGSTYLSRMYVSEPLAAQTLGASTIKGTIRVLESGSNDNLDALRLTVRVVSADGGTFRSPNVYGPTNGTVAEFNSSLRAKRLAVGGATAEVVISAGDRLAIEIGTTNTTNGTSLSDSISYGDAHATTDLGDNETDTAAYNPFVELAATLAFLNTATANKTEADDTFSATGKLTLVSNLAKTEAGDTISSAARLALQAVLAKTEAGDTLASAATVADNALTGTASLNESGDALSASGKIAIKGQTATYESGDTVSFSSRLYVQGALIRTEADDSISSAARTPIAATVTKTEAADVVVCTAFVPIHGLISRTEAADTISSAGTVRRDEVLASATLQNAGDTIVAAGRLLVFGSYAVYEHSDTAAAAAHLFTPPLHLHARRFQAAVSAGNLFAIEAAETPGSIAALGELLPIGVDGGPAPAEAFAL